MKLGWSSKLFDHRIMSVRNSWNDKSIGVASFDGFIKIVDKAKSFIFIFEKKIVEV